MTTARADRFVGRSILRREDRRLLMGQGQFVADLVLPRMLHAAFVRSPVAHARIKAVDLSRAKTTPGVVMALSGAELMRLLPPVPDSRERGVPRTACRGADLRIQVFPSP